MKNKDIAGQESIYSFLTADVPIGFVEESKRGNVIPFERLKDYIGKRVIYQSATGSEPDTKFWHKVVLIKDYYEKSDQYYSKEEDGVVTYMNDFVMSLQSKETKKKYHKAFVCDRIAYSDDERTKKANSWLSEAYCRNGRYHITHNSSQVNFFELKI